ncbi:MAG: replication factor C small subunit [Candidatus Aenigmatarchaeota archaeon]
MSVEVWTEKYRPKSLEDIVNHEKVVSRLKAFVEDNNIPHLLFSGPAGTGKSASALAIAHEIFGDKWKRNYLELNASDTRGIDVIRNEVKDFARTKSVGDVPFKIILLDEADALTPEAQQALRRTMENYTETARFILICNYSSKIIDPIRSRCSVFRYPRLQKEDAKKLLKKIARKEDVEYEEDGLDTIFSVSQGDLRRSINILQSVAAVGETVTEEMVYEVSTQARPDAVGEMLESAVNGDFMDSRDKLQTMLLEKGIGGLDIIKEIHRQVYDLDIPEARKVQLIEKIGEYEFRIDEGADEQIQLEALLAQFTASA